MAQREQMFHQDLGPVMTDCKLNTAGENVAYGYPTGRSVVNDGWMHSEGHRANILSRDVHVMGDRRPQGPQRPLVRRAGVRPQELTRLSRRRLTEQTTAAQRALPGVRVALLLVAGPDFDTEIKQLQATMSTIEQVLDLDAHARARSPTSASRSRRPTSGTTRTTPPA